MYIYDLKLNLGHAYVETTEGYSKMNLKRIAQDFPTLRTQNSPSFSLLRDNLLRDNDIQPDDYSHLLFELQGSN